MLLDKLGPKAKTLQVPRWCSKHTAAKPFKTKVNLIYKGKNCNGNFDVYPIPVPVDIKNSPSTCNKGVGADRHNIIFYDVLEDNDKLGLQMGTATHLPKRKNRGFEEKVLHSVDSCKKN